MRWRPRLLALPRHDRASARHMLKGRGNAGERLYWSKSLSLITISGRCGLFERAASATSLIVSMIAFTCSSRMPLACFVREFVHCQRRFSLLQPQSRSRGGSPRDCCAAVYRTKVEDKRNYSLRHLLRWPV